MTSFPPSSPKAKKYLQDGSRVWATSGGKENNDDTFWQPKGDTRNKEPSWEQDYRRKLPEVSSKAVNTKQDDASKAPLYLFGSKKAIQGNWNWYHSKFKSEKRGYTAGAARYLVNIQEDYPRKLESISRPWVRKKSTHQGGTWEHPRQLHNPLLDEMTYVFYASGQEAGTITDVGVVQLLMVDTNIRENNKL